MYPYVLSNDSVTVVYGGKPHVVKRGSPNFKALKEALYVEAWSDVPKLLSVAKAIQDWAKGKFKVVHEVITYDGKPLPSNLNTRIMTMVTEGESPNAMLNFWERLQKNPSMRSVEQLWSFLEHEGIPLTPDGCFLAYKGVNENYTDCHTGTFSNKPGTTHEMPRNEISDDPRHACHKGFHVGALAYAENFAGANGRVVVCKVDPKDVVCIPFDSSYQKMRVCKYEVIKNHGSLLPSTYIDPEEDEALEDLTDSEFGQFEEMDSYELMGCTIDALRRYATHGLGIIGASKIPGGKTTLISRILNVRRH